MLLEKVKKKTYTFNLSNSEELQEYNKLLADPSVTVLQTDLVSQEKSHFEKDFSEKETNHVVILLVEECSL